jgi:cell division protein FtsZ
MSLTQADALLVSLVGGPGLTMTEVGSLMDQIQRQAASARLIVGTAVDEQMGDRLHVTLISTETQSAPAGVPEAAVGFDPVARLAAAAVESLGPPLQGPAYRREGGVPSGGSGTSSHGEPQDRMRLQRLGGGVMGVRKPKWQQGMLPLEIVSKGRFEKSEPTLYRGEDLDVPTYIRRGIALN